MPYSSLRIGIFKISIPENKVVLPCLFRAYIVYTAIAPAIVIVTPYSM